MQIKDVFRRIFIEYAHLSETLETGSSCSCSLNQSYYRFAVTFESREFVLVEEFYDLLKQQFKKYSIDNNWSDFSQVYNYDNEFLCSYSLYVMITDSSYGRIKFFQRKALRKNNKY